MKIFQLKRKKEEGGFRLANKLSHIITKGWNFELYSYSWIMDGRINS